MKLRVNLYTDEFRPKRLWLTLPQMLLGWLGLLVLLLAWWGEASGSSASSSRPTASGSSN